MSITEWICVIVIMSFPIALVIAGIIGLIYMCVGNKRILNTMYISMPKPDDFYISIGDIVLVDVSKFGRGYLNTYAECKVIEVLKRAVKIQKENLENSKGYWEDWIDKAQIIEILPKK